MTWVPWAELVDGVRAAAAEFDRLLPETAGVGPADSLTVRAILVVNRPDGEPEVFPGDLTWKEYVLVQRLHLLDHRNQLRRLRGAG